MDAHSQQMPGVGAEIAGAAVPVEPLAYDDGAGVDPYRGVVRGVGWVAVVAGASLALRDVLQLVGWLGGWSDPFLFRMNQAGGVGGLPPSAWLAAASVGSLVSAVAWVVGGAGCLTGRRRWARWALAGGAMVSLVVVGGSLGLWLVYNTLMPVGRGGGMTFAAAVFEVAPRVGSMVVTLAFPALLLVLGTRREVWR
jgi:hypothetical protein